MDLKLRIEGKSEAVRDFLTFLQTYHKYSSHSKANYFFSPQENRAEIEFIHVERLED
jgi:hypothetical protein